MCPLPPSTKLAINRSYEFEYDVDDIGNGGCKLDTIHFV